MSGSGMVLGQAARNGLSSFGYDLDPLARLISRVGATRINEERARKALFQLLEATTGAAAEGRDVSLSWIDDDAETKAFVDYWFGRKQKRQLRLLSYFLLVEPVVRNKKIIDVLKVAISRLIVSKEPKASLARDTAHSRPHKVIKTSKYEILSELPSSLEHVLTALSSSEILIDTRTYLGDARNMTRVGDASIDAIITSPPYLNAIDYLRGHKFSLVWFGYSVSQLRSIRATSIGAEISLDADTDVRFARLSTRLGLKQLKPRTLRILERYYRDLQEQLAESYRTLKPGGTGTYVIGNSTLNGCYVLNNELLKSAAKVAGFSLSGEVTREIPSNRRYLPIPKSLGNSLAARMRTEHIIELRKPRPRRLRLN
ncbi:MAG: hypothetical protein AAGA22_00095 [Pseudomonadota bacterium]